MAGNSTPVSGTNYPVMRTNVSHIFVIGDILGQPMLAHKAVRGAQVAAQVEAQVDLPAMEPTALTACEALQRSGKNQPRTNPYIAGCF